MSGRFRLDPRDSRPPPELPTLAPLAPAPAPPPPPPPPAPVAAAAAPTGRRRVLLLGGALVALLLLGGGVAVYVATLEGYPDAYVLERSEYPTGVSLARLSQSEMSDLGISSNPGEIARNDLDEYETNDGREPDRGYAQALSAGGGRVLVLALQYPNEEAATSFARDARAVCSFANGAVLRDESVVVVIAPEGSAGRAQVRAIAGALRDKTADLAPVCGAG